MTMFSVPRRHWLSYGTDPLPSPQEALRQPFAAFPSWFLRIECDRCHKVRIHPPKTAGQVERFRRLAVMPPGYGPGPAAASAMATIH